MLRRSWTVWAVAVLLLSGKVAAQSPGVPLPGTVELGGFGQGTWFDEDAGRVNAVPRDGFGYGGRIGMFLFGPRFQVEGDGYYSPQDRDLSESFCCTGAQPTEVDASAFALRLNYNLPLGSLMGRQSQFIVGGGAVRTNYKFKGGSEPESDVNSYGASGLAGLRIGVANRTAIRLDGVIDHMPDREPGANTNLHARAGVSFLLGGARPSPVVMPSLLPPLAPAPAPPAPAPPAERLIQVCVVQNGQLQAVAASFRPAMNDTVIGGRAFAQAHPATAPDYAVGASWFIQQDRVDFVDGTWVKFGVTRVIQPSQLQRVGEMMGTPLFADVGRQAPYDVVYVPVRPGCEFQPYQDAATIQVRG